MKKTIVLTMITIMSLTVLAACGDVSNIEAVPDDGEHATITGLDNDGIIEDELTVNTFLPEESLPPTTFPASEQTLEPNLIGTWDYLTTALESSEGLLFEPMMSGFDYPYIEIHENNVIITYSYETVIRGVFTQINHNQHNQYEFLLTELSQTEEGGGAQWSPDYNMSLLYDAGSGVLRWSFLEGPGYIMDVHHYYIISPESMDREVKITVGDYDVTVDDEYGMEWDKYTIPKLVLYSQHMDGAYSYSTDYELSRRFSETPYFMLPYIALIGDEVLQSHGGITVREHLCSSIIYGSYYLQDNLSDSVIEILDEYDNLYPSGPVADVLTCLRENLDKQLSINNNFIGE